MAANNKIRSSSMLVLNIPYGKGCFVKTVKNFSLTSALTIMRPDSACGWGVGGRVQPISDSWFEFPSQANKTFHLYGVGEVMSDLYGLFHCRGQTRIQTGFTKSLKSRVRGAFWNDAVLYRSIIIHNSYWFADRKGLAIFVQPSFVRLFPHQYSTYFVFLYVWCGILRSIRAYVSLQKLPGFDLFSSASAEPNGPVFGSSLNMRWKVGSVR